MLRHVALLIILLSILFLDLFIPAVLSTSVFIMTMIVCACLLDGHGRLTRILVVGVGLPALAMIVGTVFFGDAPWWGRFVRQPFAIVMAVLLIGFLFYCGGLILLSLISSRRITFNEILGTISLYLIVGMAWGYTYWLVEQQRPGSFRVAASDEMPSDVGGEGRDSNGMPFVYFSFVTQTTLGYGDMTPHSPLARRLVIIQTIIGQFYVAVVVAYLMSVLLRSQSLSERPGREDG